MREKRKRKFEEVSLNCCNIPALPSELTLSTAPLLPRLQLSPRGDLPGWTEVVPHSPESSFWLGYTLRTSLLNCPVFCRGIRVIIILLIH